MAIKLGICSWCVPSDLWQALPRLKEMGLNGVELTLDKGYKTAKLFTESGKKELLELSKKHEMIFPSMGLNIFCSIEIFNCEENVFDDIISIALETANFFGVKILQVPAFGASMIKTTTQFDDTVKAFVKMCDMANAYGITISTENALSASENLKMHKAVNRNNFKIYFDTQNAFLLGGHNMAQMAHDFKGLICEIHCKDGIDKMGNLLLGKGNSDFFATAKAISEIGFNGFIHTENSYLNMANADKEKAYELLKNDIEIMQKAFV